LVVSIRATDCQTWTDRSDAHRSLARSVTFAYLAMRWRHPQQLVKRLSVCLKSSCHESELSDTPASTYRVLSLNTSGGFELKDFAALAGTLLLLNVVAAAQAPSTKPSLEGLRFLLGEWEGVGGGGPGSGKGEFSFAFDLQNKAIIRKNYA